MKKIDVIPCKHKREETTKLMVPEIPLYRYNPKLKEELDKGTITEDFALKLYRAMLFQRAFEFTVRDLENKSLVPHDWCVC
jgi:hypothetical protein